MEIRNLSKYCKCCTCGGDLPTTPTFLQIPVAITWDFPKWGNFITGVENQGVAYVCDACARNPNTAITDVKNVLEFQPGYVVICHPIYWTVQDGGIKCSLLPEPKTP